MKKSVSGLLCLALLLLLPIQAETFPAESEKVLSKRLELYVYMHDLFSHTHAEFAAIKSVIDTSGHITAEMHSRILENFTRFNRVQSHLKKNWDDFHTFLEIGVPRDILSFNQEERENFKIKLAGLGVASRARQFSNSCDLVDLFSKHKTIREKLNEIGAQSGSSFEEIFQEFTSENLRKGLMESAQTFLSMCEDLAGSTGIRTQDQQLLFILTEIMNSPMLIKLTETSWLEKMAEKFSIFFSERWRNICLAYKNFKVSFSRFFGNAVGNLKSNRKPYVNAGELMPRLLAVLKPGDILVEKTGFLITDRFIPGHFGHVAIYSGKPEDLFQGLLSRERDQIEQCLEKLSSVEGKQKESYYTSEVLEALRSGITIHSLEHFLRIDDLAVLRLKSGYPEVHVDENYLRQSLLKAFSYLGTPYDFAFDVNSSSVIVCSEMPYQCMPHIPFRVKEVLGSWTIGPDDVAVAAGDGIERPLELVFFVHRGKIVEETEKMALYIDLLNESGSKYEQFPQYERDRDSCDEYPWQ